MNEKRAAVWEAARRRGLAGGWRANDALFIVIR